MHGEGHHDEHHGEKKSVLKKVKAKAKKIKESIKEHVGHGHEVNEDDEDDEMDTDPEIHGILTHFHSKNILVFKEPTQPKVKLMVKALLYTLNTLPYLSFIRKFEKHK